VLCIYCTYYDIKVWFLEVGGIGGIGGIGGDREGLALYWCL